jgi:NADPH-dependent curcumin reductase CurA
LYNTTLGYPEPDVHTATDTSETIDIDNVPLNGGFLVKTLVLSIDPYLRSKMQDASKQTFTVCPPFSITNGKADAGPRFQSAFTIGEP